MPSVAVSYTTSSPMVGRQWSGTISRLCVCGCSRIFQVYVRSLCCLRTNSLLLYRQSTAALAADRTDRTHQDLRGRRSAFRQAARCVSSAFECLHCSYLRFVDNYSVVLLPCLSPNFWCHGHRPISGPPPCAAAYAYPYIRCTSSPPMR